MSVNNVSGDAMQLSFQQGKSLSVQINGQTVTLTNLSEADKNAIQSCNGNEAAIRKYCASRNISLGTPNSDSAPSVFGARSGSQVQVPVTGNVDAANAMVDQFKNNSENIRELPPNYQKMYYAAGKDETKQREVIRQYFNDKEYFPDGVGNGKKIFGNRNSTKNEGGLKFSTELEDSVLVDDKGKPIKENQEKRFEKVKAQFSAQMDNQLAEIENNSTMSPEQKRVAKDNLLMNEAFNSSLKPQVTKLAEEIKKNTATTNKNTYYNLAFTQEEKNEVSEKARDLNTKVFALMDKPEAQLSADEKNLLDKYKKAYNDRFPDNQIGENEHLYGAQQPSDKTRYQKNAMAVSRMLATEAKLSGLDAEQVLNLNNPIDLSDEQRTTLAKAQMKESVTHENEIQELTSQLTAPTFIQKKIDFWKEELEKASPEEKKSIENEIQELTAQLEKANTVDRDSIKKKISTLESNSEKMLKNIRKGTIADQAQAQVEFETYKQNYDNTCVSWDKKGAKAQEKETPGANNTHLNKYAQELIKKDATFRADVCDEVKESEADFEVDGKYYKLNSDKYKSRMQHIANPNRSNNDKALDSDMYASVSEWSKFANEHAKKSSHVATKGERSDVQEMIEAAGIQVGKDRTYAMRAGKMGKDALIGAGAGALAGLGDELYKSAIKLNFAGTAKGVVSGIASGVVKGSLSGPVTLNGTSTHESIVQKYDPKSGQYITVGHQVTEVPIELTGDVTLNGDVKADLPYEKDAALDYNGKVSDKFNWGDAGKSALKGGLIGGAIGGLSRGVRYLFKKKTNADYANDDTAKDTIRANTGYQEKTEVPAAKEPVKALTEEVKEEVEIKETPVEKEIPYVEYKLRRVGGQVETIGHLVTARYGVKPGTSEYRAVLKYIREVNGVRNGQIPPGDKWKLPEWIPADKLGEGHEKIDRRDNVKIGRENYRKGAKAGGGAYTGKYTDIQQTTVRTQKTVRGADVWDPNLRKRPKK